MKYVRVRQAFLGLLFTGYGTALMAAPPSAEEMWEIIQEQQKTIEELKSKLEQTEEKVTATESKVKETEQKVEATADAVEQQTYGTSTAGSWADRTSIGGYGELHYNNLKDQVGDNDLNRVDFHRFVLYFGHEFNDDIRMFSEIEIEHALAGDGAPGEVELEQAWVELDMNNQHRLRAGLDILPIGIINQIHEPNTFYGVERNRVETEIIPTTWWEAGLMFDGEFGRVACDRRCLAGGRSGFYRRAGTGLELRRGCPLGTCGTDHRQQCLPSP